MWASTILEALGLAWPIIGSEPIPVPGLARFAALPVAPLLMSVSLLCSVWLSVGRWHTEGRMIAFAWLAGAVGIPSALFFSLSFFGYPLAWAALGVCRAIRRRWRAPCTSPAKPNSRLQRPAARKVDACETRD